MSDSPREQLRKVPAHLFEMLSPEQSEALRLELERDPNVARALERVKERLSQWDPQEHPAQQELASVAAGDSWDAVEHALTCRECAFELAVLAAEARGSVNANAFPGSISVWLRAAAALAIGGGAFILGNQLEESPLTESSSVPLVLQSTRGAGETTIAYASVRGKTLTLIVQAPIPPGKAAWTLTQEGRPIAQGDLEVGEGPHLRDLAFSVSGEQLEPGQGVLTLTGAEGHVIRVWEFSISR